MGPCTQTLSGLFARPGASRNYQKASLSRARSATILCAACVGESEISIAKYVVEHQITTSPIVAQWVAAARASFSWWSFLWYSLEVFVCLAQNVPGAALNKQPFQILCFPEEQHMHCGRPGAYIRAVGTYAAPVPLAHLFLQILGQTRHIWKYGASMAARATATFLLPVWG